MMDTAKFKELFLPLYPKLYRIAFRMVGNPEDAEDLLQDTYAKLWKNRNDLPDLVSCEAFAVTVLKNACLDFLKKKKTYISPLEEINLREGEFSASELIEAEDIRSFIRSVVDRLPEQQQRVFQLFYRDHFSMEEIGEITGLNYNNIKVILSRVRKQVKTYGQKLELI